MHVKQYIFVVILIGYHYISNAQVRSFNVDPQKINRELASQLDSIFQEDQALRLKFSVLRKEQAQSTVLDSLSALMRLKDSTNLVFVEQLIGKYGWLGPEEVGFEGAQALFLVIQHSSLRTQKKYYPLILEAEKNRKILSSNVAILEDRIAIREGRQQTYGSQGYYDREQKKLFIYPLKDPERIDSLRSSRGLSKMSDYVKDWNLDTYKSYLSHARELSKKQIEL